MKIRIGLRENNFFRKILIMGFIVFFGSNEYFGWNKFPQSGAERVFDMIWQLLLFIGSLGTLIKIMVLDNLQNITIIKIHENTDCK